MDTQQTMAVIVGDEPEKHALEMGVAQLVGQVYETVPLVHKRSLLEHLLQPLGVLALVAVADGIFAKIRFRGGWPHLNVRLEDAKDVQVSDVIALVNYVQQVSIQTVDGLAQMLAGMPTMASSTAAALLMTVLMQRARNRRVEDASFHGPRLNRE